MKQTAKSLSTYAADTSGVCSALYELGGMTVVHDASGCNSTYSTFDEPRWYDRESMIYISGLTEMEAIMGDDEKLIRDITETAEKLHPKFIALCGSPVPLMIGTDYEAVAVEVSARTGLPAYGIHTSGMHSYLMGASQAFDVLAKKFCRSNLEPAKKSLSVNILGATPLDFALNGSVDSIGEWVRKAGFRVNCCFAMGSSLEEIALAGAAGVNLVLSYDGLAAARTLQERFGTPYLVGVPFGEAFAGQLTEELHRTAETGQSCVACTLRSGKREGVAVVGESVSAGSLACAIEREYGLPAHVLCPLETLPELLASGDSLIPDEDDAIRLFPRAAGVVGDPMYRPVCPADVPFYDWPHIAYSGRCFQKSIPNLIGRKLKTGGLTE